MGSAYDLKSDLKNYMLLNILRPLVDISIHGFFNGFIYLGASIIV